MNEIGKTWENRIAFHREGLTSAHLMQMEDGDDTAILAAIENGRIRAIVTTSYGAFLLEPEDIDPAFWGFAASNYYWVTGNLHDRRQLAELIGVTPSTIGGRTLSGSRAPEPSGMSLDEMADLTCPAKVREFGWKRRIKP